MLTLHYTTPVHTVSHVTANISSVFSKENYLINISFDIALLLSESLSLKLFM